MAEGISCRGRGSWDISNWLWIMIVVIYQIHVSTFSNITSLPIILSHVLTHPWQITLSLSLIKVTLIVILYFLSKSVFPRKNAFQSHTLNWSRLYYKACKMNKIWKRHFCNSHECVRELYRANSYHCQVISDTAIIFIWQKAIPIRGCNNSPPNS